MKGFESPGGGSIFTSILFSPGEVALNLKEAGCMSRPARRCTVFFPRGRPSTVRARARATSTAAGAGAELERRTSTLTSSPTMTDSGAFRSLTPTSFLSRSPASPKATQWTGKPAAAASSTGSPGELCLPSESITSPAQSSPASSRARAMRPRRSVLAPSGRGFTPSCCEPSKERTVSLHASSRVLTTVCDARREALATFHLLPAPSSLSAMERDESTAMKAVGRFCTRPGRLRTGFSPSQARKNRATARAANSRDQSRLTR